MQTLKEVKDFVNGLSAEQKLAALRNTLDAISECPGCRSFNLNQYIGREITLNELVQALDYEVLWTKGYNVYLTNDTMKIYHAISILRAFNEYTKFIESDRQPEPLTRYGNNNR